MRQQNYGAPRAPPSSQKPKSLFNFTDEYTEPQNRSVAALPPSTPSTSLGNSRLFQETGGFSVSSSQTGKETSKKSELGDLPPAVDLMKSDREFQVYHPNTTADLKTENQMNMSYAPQQGYGVSQQNNVTYGPPSPQQKRAHQQQQQFQHIRSQELLQSDGPHSTFPSQGTLDFETQEHWVTVFGFPESHLSLVLQQFQKYGEIIEKYAGEGNWVHLRFKNSSQAKNALAKNGKLIGSGVLIGVSLGIIPSGSRKYATGLDHKPPVQPTFGSQNSDQILFQNNPSKLLATNIYPPSSNSYQVQAAAPVTAPRPQTSWWSTISEYIFGT